MLQQMCMRIHPQRHPELVRTWLHVSPYAICAEHHRSRVHLQMHSTQRIRILQLERKTCPEKSCWIFAIFDPETLGSWQQIWRLPQRQNLNLHHSSPTRQESNGWRERESVPIQMTRLLNFSDANVTKGTWASNATTLPTRPCCCFSVPLVCRGRPFTANKRERKLIRTCQHCGKLCQSWQLLLQFFQTIQVKPCRAGPWSNSWSNCNIWSLVHALLRAMHTNEKIWKRIEKASNIQWHLHALTLSESLSIMSSGAALNMPNV